MFLSKSLTFYGKERFSGCIFDWYGLLSLFNTSHLSCVLFLVAVLIFEVYELCVFLSGDFNLSFSSLMN